MLGHGSVSWEEFQAIKVALQRAELMKADVGNIQHGVEFSDNFTPLVAQDLDAVWTSETFADEDLVLSNMLYEKDVDSPLHELVTVKEYGQEDTIEGFFAEGGVTEIEESELQRKITRVKYLGVQRQITDVATMTGIIGNGMVSKRGLQVQTELGMKSLAGRYETALFHADSALNPLHFDGLIKQIDDGAASGFYTDAAGTAPTLKDIIRRVFAIADRPTYGKVDAILMSSDQLGQMINIAQAYQQWRPGDAKGGENQLVFNAGALSLVGPGGRMIPIKAAPKMKLKSNPFSLSGSVGRVPAGLVLGDITIGAVAGPPGFDAADAGDYDYVVVGIGDSGAVAFTYAGSITVGTGQRVQVDIVDQDIPEASTTLAAGVRYYMLYRSAKDAGAPASIDDMTLVGRFPRAGFGSDSQFYDDGSLKPGHGHILLLTSDQRSIYVAKLLGTIRRPLAEVATAKPFMLMRFCTPHIRHPLKQAGWFNVPDELNL